MKKILTKNPNKGTRTHSIWFDFLCIRLYLIKSFYNARNIHKKCILNNKVFTIFQFDWCIWPPTQYINFTLVPPALRVLYVNVVTVIWDVFLSYIKHYVSFLYFAIFCQIYKKFYILICRIDKSKKKCPSSPKIKIELHSDPNFRLQFL